MPPVWPGVRARPPLVSVFLEGPPTILLQLVPERGGRWTLVCLQYLFFLLTTILGDF